MGAELDMLRHGAPGERQAPQLPPAPTPPDVIPRSTQMPDDVKRVMDAQSRPIEKYLQAASPVPTLLVHPRNGKQLVVISCAFGGAVVSVSFRTQQKPFLVLPNAGTWKWILGPEEGLLGATTADVVVTGVARDV